MQKKIITSTVLIALFVTSLLSTMSGTFVLKDEHPMFKSNVVDRIVISSDTMSITADEILQFSATLYTTTNSTIQDDVNWTASNGSISDDGIFYPWSSGTVEIEADYGGVTGSLNITVVAGAATSISIITSTVSVLEQNVLQAQVMDGRGNVKPASSQTVWDIDGTYIGTGSPIWIPEETGYFNARARLYQLETSANISVVAGSPHSFVFQDFMTVIAGETFT